jgi:hypothetical protein
MKRSGNPSISRKHAQRKSLWILPLVWLGTQGVWGERGPQWRSWESQAVGHTGVTTERGTGALFMNPALLQDHSGIGGGLYTDVGLNGVLLDYAEWAKDNYQYFNSLDSLLNHIQPIDNKWAPFSQSFVVGGSYNNYALALVGDLRYDLTLGKAVLTPVPGAGANADIVFALGRGFELPQDYRVGFSVRYLHRSRLEPQLIGITDPRFFEVYNTLKEKNDGLSSAQEKLKVASKLAETEQGVGMVLGVQRSIDDHWKAGASLQDFPAVLGGSPLRPQMNIGISYDRDFGALEGLITNFSGSFDWQDFLIPGAPWFKQFKMGLGAHGYLQRTTAAGKIERGREVLFIGCGANDGYPTFGVRFGYFLYLSYLYTAEETGTYPGQRPLSFHKLSIDLSM